MAVVRIGAPLRNFIMGTDPDPEVVPDLFELVDLLEGYPKYPAGVEIPERLFYQVWYWADLLSWSDASQGEARSCNAALIDLQKAGYRP